MDLYEHNYMLVRLLAPSLRSMANGDHVSEVVDALPLEIAELRHERYTSTFRLTYRLSERYARNDKPGREPNLAVRLYHDARTCEVMSGLLPGETLETRRTRDLDEGHRLNAFLDRWLAYCLRQGYVFDSMDASRVVSMRAANWRGARPGSEIGSTSASPAATTGRHQGNNLEVPPNSNGG